MHAMTYRLSGADNYLLKSQADQSAPLNRLLRLPVTLLFEGTVLRDAVKANPFKVKGCSDWTPQPALLHEP